MEISQKKLYSWFWRWDYEEKVPGPMAEKTAPQAQEAWKKGSLGALQAEGLRRGEEVVFADKMGLGLLRQVRRVRGRRGRS
jgi:hypothetical protein